MATKLPAIHPGEVLLEEFLEPTGRSQDRLAKDISVPPRRINEIVHGKRAVTADTALRLARYFGTTPRFWLNLQTQYELDIEADRLGDRLDHEVAAHGRDKPAHHSPRSGGHCGPKPAWLLLLLQQVLPTRPRRRVSRAPADGGALATSRATSP